MVGVSCYPEPDPRGHCLCRTAARPRGRPKVYVWGARAYAEADEACIVMAADECLDNFRQEEEVTISYLAEEKRMKEKYAHLLTQ